MRNPSRRSLNGRRSPQATSAGADSAKRRRHLGRQFPVPPGGFEPPPLPPEGSALSPELWGPRGATTVAGPAWAPGQRVSRTRRDCRADGRRGAGLPRASRPHRACVSGPCGVARSARRCKRAPNVQPRTRRRARRRSWSPSDGRRGTGPPRASCPHRADFAGPCGLARSVRRCKRAPNVQPRTRRRARHCAWWPSDGRRGADPPRASRPHRACVSGPCKVARSVRRCKRAPSVQPRTGRRTPHRAGAVASARGRRRRRRRRLQRCAHRIDDGLCAAGLGEQR